MITKPILTWIPIHGWHNAELVGFDLVRGLLRARLDGEIMFIGRAASEGSSLKSRLDAYRKPKGTGRNHYAGRMIYKHRAEIVMETAVVGLPADDITRLADELIEKHRPPWNMPTEGFRK